ncbi:MAG: hypothetical protein ABIJ33_04010 [Patescibacteria group bacterium]
MTLLSKNWYDGDTMILRFKPCNLVLLMPILMLVLIAIFLRFWRLDQVPPSPYWEEVALGYDAYSILETGLDHHGNRLPIVAFESFGDWKPALYFYAVVPLIKFVGLNVWAIRLPSALAGILIVLGIGYLTAWLIKIAKTKQVLQMEFKLGWPVVAGVAVATFSPWLIQFSRGGWESNLATALILWGVILLLRFRQFWHRILGVLLLALAMYTYHAARVIAPGLLVGVLLFEQLTTTRTIFDLFGFSTWMKRFVKLKQSIFFLGLLFCLAIPFVLPNQSQKIGHRFAETSIFANLDPIIESNLRQDRSGNTLLSRIVFHRYRYFGQQILSQALTHLSPDYLFLSGDANPRHNPGIGGLILPINAIFLIWGLSTLIIAHKKTALLLTGWLIITILPAATSVAVPHALRTLALAPVWLSFIGLGWWTAFEFLKTRFKYQRLWSGMLVSLCIFIYGFFFARYFLYYINVYPITSSSQWQSGYEQMIRAVNDREILSPEKNVYIARAQGRPAIYYWFYTQTDPIRVQRAEATAQKDQSEFLEFENKYFIDRVDQLPVSSAILAISDDQYRQLKNLRPGLENDLLFNLEVKDLNQTTVWHVLELK